jgi:hypothetical protein
MYPTSSSALTSLVEQLLPTHHSLGLGLTVNEQGLRTRNSNIDVGIKLSCRVFQAHLISCQQQDLHQTQTSLPDLLQSS